jgi:hypothetical protein
MYRILDKASYRACATDVVAVKISKLKGIPKTTRKIIKYGSREEAKNTI